jgi:hypothetical protein
LKNRKEVTVFSPDSIATLVLQKAAYWIITKAARLTTLRREPLRFLDAIEAIIANR